MDIFKGSKSGCHSKGIIRETKKFMNIFILLIILSSISTNTIQYNLQSRSNIYKEHAVFTSLMFSFGYGVFKCFPFLDERLSRSRTLDCEAMYPRAIAWIHQEMLLRGFKQHDYILSTSRFWNIPVQTKLPYLIEIPQSGFQEIEALLEKSSNSPLLNRYRSIFHIFCSQLSSNFIPQLNTASNSVAIWMSLIFATMVPPACFFMEQRKMYANNSLDFIVHVALATLPCISLYKAYSAHRKYIDTIASHISTAIDMLPEELVPACIQFFEESKSRYLYNTTDMKYDAFIQQLKNRLPSTH